MKPLLRLADMCTLLVSELNSQGIAEIVEHVLLTSRTGSVNAAFTGANIVMDTEGSSNCAVNPRVCTFPPPSKSQEYSVRTCTVLTLQSSSLV